MSKSVRDKTRPVRPNFRRARLPVSRISCPPRLRRPRVSARRRPVWRPVVRLSAAGEGLFTDTPRGLQADFSEETEVFAKYPE